VLLAGAAVLFVAAAWRLAIQPYVSALIAVRRGIEVEARSLAADEATVEAARGVGRSLRAEQDSLARLSAGFLAGPDAGLAAAALSQLVQDQAEASRVHLARVSPGASKPAGPGLLSVSADLDGESDLEGIVTFLAMLRSDSTFLRIPSLEVTNPASGRRRSGAAMPLTLKLTVRGYLRRARSKPQPASAAQRARGRPPIRGPPSARGGGRS
jgi:hypothetical protein